jgi:hypothetical protein
MANRRDRSPEPGLTGRAAVHSREGAGGGYSGACKIRRCSGGGAFGSRVEEENQRAFHDLWGDEVQLVGVLNEELLRRVLSRDNVRAYAVLIYRRENMGHRPIVRTATRLYGEG